MLSSVWFQDLDSFLCGHHDAYHHQYVKTYFPFGDRDNEQEEDAEEKATWFFCCVTQQTAVNDRLNGKQSQKIERLVLRA